MRHYLSEFGPYEIVDDADSATGLPEAAATLRQFLNMAAVEAAQFMGVPPEFISSPWDGEGDVIDVEGELVEDAPALPAGEVGP